MDSELLRDILAVLEEETSNREYDFAGLECGNCVAGVPMPHSLGCRIRQAIYKAERAADAAERRANACPSCAAGSGDVCDDCSDDEQHERQQHERSHGPGRP